MAIGNAHDLVPDDLAAVIPPMYGTDHEDDPVAQVKLFVPGTSWTWYVTEYDRRSRECFGLVVGFEREVGYFSLRELERVRGKGGTRVERDLDFDRTPISRCP